MVTEETKVKTITLSVRLPEPLRDRIKELADKRQWSLNVWIKNALEREAKAR